MRITFLILGRFPTQKAYGITTTETIRCLNSRGHEVTVFSIASTDNLNNSDSIGFTSRFYRENSLAKFLKRFAYSGTGILPIVSWRVYWQLIYFLNKEVFLQSKTDLFWVRDFLALRFIPRTSKSVFEIHQKPKKIWQPMLKRRAKHEASLIAPISRSIERILSSQYPSIDSCYSPMGIRSDQIADAQSGNSFIDRLEKLKGEEYRDLRIGYVGKFSPSGFSKGVEDLLGIAALIKRNKLGFKVAIKGGLLEEVDRLKSLAQQYELCESDVEISGHMSHQSAIAEMSNLDVIVLTRPVSVKYAGFPLKALESVARGRIILAADCETYRDIFDSEYQPYWYSSPNPEEMLIVIYQALADTELIKRISSGIEFASQFLWENRTERMLKTLDLSESEQN